MPSIDSAEASAFRASIRAPLQAAVPPDVRRKVLAHEALDKDDMVRWQRALSALGWLGWTWPTAFGGPGWTPEQVQVFEEECWLAGAPEVHAFGLRMLAPILMAHGSAEQQALHLPRMLRVEDWWCQGYSEPGAGSDLASLTTRATIEGDHFILRGQKTWTTYAQHANRMFCLVRTDVSARPQAGISFVLLDMQSPGITVRPLILMDGEHEVNEVFFDDVRVPISGLVGPLHQGWAVAKALLGHERFGVGKIGRSRRELALLKRLSRRAAPGRAPRMADARWAEKIAQLEVDLLALDATLRRLMAMAARGQGLGTEASIIKLHGTRVAQSISTCLMDVMGEDLDDDTPIDDDGVTPVALTRQYLNWRKLTIYGGSDEVQRNIVAKLALGL